MTRRPLSNVAASVRTRLLSRSRAKDEDYQFLLQRYAAERFLHRLGESEYRSRLVLKGAMLLVLWGESTYRPTRDLDFTGYGNSRQSSVRSAIRAICAVPVVNDGIVFDVETLSIERHSVRTIEHSSVRDRSGPRVWQRQAASAVTLISTERRDRLSSGLAPRIPERFSRSVANVLHAASITPDPIGSATIRYPLSDSAGRILSVAHTVPSAENSPVRCCRRGTDSAARGSPARRHRAHAVAGRYFSYCARRASFSP